MWDRIICNELEFTTAFYRPLNIGYHYKLTFPFLRLSGKPLYQSGGSGEDPEEDPSDRPWGQVSRLLHGNCKLSTLCGRFIMTISNLHLTQLSFYFSVLHSGRASWISSLRLYLITTWNSLKSMGFRNFRLEVLFLLLL